MLLLFAILSSISDLSSAAVFKNQSKCDSNVVCSSLPADCLTCAFNFNCSYGEKVAVRCKPAEGVECSGNKAASFSRQLLCRFCYQTDPRDYVCDPILHCPVATAYGRFHETNCTVGKDVLCMGRRRFLRMLPCDWSSGYKWIKALILSITLGGFGFDRFYLGMWREGLGKLFSFGGLGVWTIVDVILIAIGYVGPSDGSLYV